MLVGEQFIHHLLHDGTSPVNFSIQFEILEGVRYMSMRQQHNDQKTRCHPDVN